jgi:hypothetical protein
MKPTFMGGSSGSVVTDVSSGVVCAGSPPKQDVNTNSPATVNRYAVIFLAILILMFLFNDISVKIFYVSSVYHSFYKKSPYFQKKCFEFRCNM